MVYWEKPHFSKEWKLVTPHEDKGTTPITQPCPSTPRTGKFGNVGMMHPTRGEALGLRGQPQEEFQVMPRVK